MMAEMTSTITVNKLCYFNTDEYLIATLEDTFGNLIVRACFGFVNFCLLMLQLGIGGVIKYSIKNLTEGSYTVRIKYRVMGHMLIPISSC